MENASDRELILQFQAGSLEALGVVYDRHRRLVYRTALAITNEPEAAADLLQETFLRLYRFAGRVDPERPLEPWLYRVTTNLAYTAVKRRRNWLRPLEEIAEWIVGGRKFSPQILAEMDEEALRVQQAISSLPLSQRVVVVLYYINDGFAGLRLAQRHRLPGVGLPRPGRNCLPGVPGCLSAKRQVPHEPHAPA